MGVNKISGIGAGDMMQAAGVDLVKQQKEAAEVMFADMLSMNAAGNADYSIPEVGDDAVSNVTLSQKTEVRKENVNDAYEKYQYKDKSIRAEEKAVTEQDVEKAAEEMTEFSEKVTEVLAEELHVTKEEIEAAMEQLGISVMDLLDTSNLVQLVAELEGSNNVNQLLMSESFMNIFTRVSELGNEMLSELQMTAEELDLMVTENPETFETVLGQAVSEKSADDVTVDTAEEIPVETVAAAETVNTADTGKTVVFDKASEMETAVQQTESEQQAAEESAVIVEDKRQNKENSGDGNMSEQDMPKQEEAEFKPVVKEQTAENGDGKGNETVSFHAVQTGTAEVQAPVAEAPQGITSYVAVSELLEQIVEQTRVTISAETTKMEMQLNPEHLGKLYLEVTEHEGSITAKFQTENVLVKEALETQMADLRQSLNQAGVKVDAIEVTVESHAFEQNLEQNANSEKQQEDAKPKTARHRSLNLNDLDSLSGLMTEEETLVAKMMAEQGNSVDYTA